MKVQRENEGRNWTELGMISKRGDCRGRKCKCMTVQHGGVCHRRSTPNTNGNTIKRKKRKCTNPIHQYIAVGD